MTGRRYAEGTKVPSAKSQGEIQALLIRFGATAFASGWNERGAAIEFTIGGRQYRVVLSLPSIDDAEFWRKPNHAGRRTAEETQRRYDTEVRRRWRSLLLVVKSRLEASETGISTLEDELALFAVLPDGRTAGEHLLPAIQTAYETGEIPPMMAAFAPSPPAIEAAT